MRTEVLDVDMSRDRIVDITDEVVEFVRWSEAGLLNVFAPHATAGLAIMETESGSESDLIEALARLLPRDDRYRHHHGSPGHGADHLLPVLVSPSLTVPVEGGRMLLGSWQRIVLISLNRDNPRRRVRLALLEG
ncbi:MAG TPA: secondary thiamine-phosphate synthase enzyme YjbQ [Candidatus Binatia bacterium]|nr:secondary thiamine-phosphate synthase enzyme YjbQ [Candidatus Binatia bacterium]